MTDPPRARRARCVVGLPREFLFFLWLKFGEFPRKIEVWIAGEIWMCKSRKDQQPSLDSQMIQWCHYDKWQQQQRPGGFLVKQSTRPGKLTVCYWKLLFSSLIYPVKIVIFHSYVNVYQRVPRSKQKAVEAVSRYDMVWWLVFRWDIPDTSPFPLVGCDSMWHEVWSPCHQHSEFQVPLLLLLAAAGSAFVGWQAVRKLGCRKEPKKSNGRNISLPSQIGLG